MGVSSALSALLRVVLRNSQINTESTAVYFLIFGFGYYCEDNMKLKHKRIEYKSESKFYYSDCLQSL